MGGFSIRNANFHTHSENFATRDTRIESASDRCDATFVCPLDWTLCFNVRKNLVAHRSTRNGNVTVLIKNFNAIFRHAYTCIREPGYFVCLFTVCIIRRRSVEKFSTAKSST